MRPALSNTACVVCFTAVPTVSPRKLRRAPDFVTTPPDRACFFPERLRHTKCRLYTCSLDAPDNEGRGSDEVAAPLPFLTFPSATRFFQTIC